MSLRPEAKGVEGENPFFPTMLRVYFFFFFYFPALFSSSAEPPQITPDFCRARLFFSVSL